ncbi:MAG: hypothetical protein WD276_04695 [Actinomycetota bacterium]
MSGKSWLDGPPATAVSNNGSTNYLHSTWTTDAPSGDYLNGTIPDYTAGCSTDVDPVLGAGGYCSGAYYSRANTSTLFPTAAAGSLGTWTDLVRLNTRTTHADRFSVAASGQYVHAIFATTAGYYYSQCSTDPRPLFYRRNTNYGASASWDPQVSLESASFKVDYPSIYAFGSNVYIIYTNADTGDIRFALSTNDGGTWAIKTIGHTTRVYDAGLDGCPPAPTAEGEYGAAAVAGNGTHVIAGWVTSDLGRAVAKVSTNNGTSFGQTNVLTREGALGIYGSSLLNAAADLDAAGTGRVAITWMTDVARANSGMPRGIYARFWLESSGWAPKRLIACIDTTAPCGSAALNHGTSYDSAYSPSIAMYGTSGAAVAWSSCERGGACDGSGNPGTGNDIHLIYKETGTNGATWWNGSCVSAAVDAGGCGQPHYRNLATRDNQGGNPASDDRSVNDWSSLVFDLPGDSSTGCSQATSAGGRTTPVSGCARYVNFMTRNTDYTLYEIQYAIGATGAPLP